MTDTKTANQSSEMLQAIADPTRLRIVELLVSGEKNVTEIATELSIAIVNVSHHLQVLRVAKVVTNEKQGRFVTYTLNPEIATVEGKETVIDVGWCRVLVPCSKR